MFENILIPLDGSNLAEAALPAAIEMKQRFQAHLVLIRAVEGVGSHLVQTPGILDAGSAASANIEILTQVVEAERAEAKTYLAEVLKKIGDTANVEALVAEGEPADVIAEQASQRKACLIVMSSHGRGGLGRLVFGSVADAVLRQSPAPILLMRSQSSD